MKSPLPVLLFGILLIMMSGCVADSGSYGGSITFSVQFDSLPGGNEYALRIELETDDGKESHSRDIALSPEGGGETLFEGIRSGMWDIRILFLENGSELEDTYATIEVTEDVPLEAEITGYYENGTVRMVISWSPGDQDADIAIDDMLIYFREERYTTGEWQEHTAMISIGDFRVLAGIAMLYPDGDSVFSGSRAGEESAYFIQSDDNAVFVIRQNYFDRGEYVLQLFDTAGAVVTATRRIDADLDIFGPPTGVNPDDTSPKQDPTVTIPVSWNNNGEYSSIVVVAYPEDDPKSPLKFGAVLGGGVTYTSIPANTLGTTTTYKLAILAFNDVIEPNMLTTASSYAVDNLIVHFGLTHSVPFSYIGVLGTTFKTL